MWAVQVQTYGHTMVQACKSLLAVGIVALPPHLDSLGFWMEFSMPPLVEKAVLQESFLWSLLSGLR